MTLAPARPAFLFVSLHCAWCKCDPCMCPRTSPCACGGHLVEIGTLAETMQAHQRTPEHQAWRERCGL